jgi:hypothetical protein
MPGEYTTPRTQVSRDETESEVLDYISQHGNDLSFTEAFWRKCEPHPYETRRYPVWVETQRLHMEGKSLAEISRQTGAKPSSVRRWTRFEQRPKLAHFLQSYLQLGRPTPGFVWLSVNNTSGHAIPLGRFVEVPKVISEWKDVAWVLGQLEPLQEMGMGLSREYAFGFLVGMVIGDAPKSRAKNWRRHLGLVLSRRYQTSESIGEFTALYARNFGLRMHRAKDHPKPDNKPHEFYDWTSQASPLVDWIFNVCLGLKDGELTTYDAVRMDWVYDAPTEFRRGMIQGIAESDGSVSMASQTVEFWIGPNWNFFKQVLSTFGVKSFQNREALSVTRSQVAKLGDIPAFSPVLKTVRYLRFQKLVNARHIQHGKRIPAEIRDFIMKNSRGESVPKVSEKVLDRFGVVLSFEAVQRWVEKTKLKPIESSNCGS